MNVRRDACNVQANSIGLTGERSMEGVLKILDHRATNSATPVNVNESAP